MAFILLVTITKKYSVFVHETSGKRVASAMEKPTEFWVFFTAYVMIKNEL